MELPGKLKSLFAKDRQEKNLFFAVLFEQTRLTASVFLSRTDDTEIIAFRSAPFSGSVEDSVSVLDRLLSGLADEDSRAEDVENTIFGFPQEFLKEGEIRGNIKKQLKSIVEKLSLVPCGYVVVSEALAYYLSSQAGIQESAIFVGIAETEIHVSLVKIGSIIEEKTTARTDEICSDLETVLNSFKQEVLPAKIVLYDNTHDLSKVKNELLDYSWEEKCNFLHFPKIELLPAVAILQAVISAYTKQDAKLIHEGGFPQTKKAEPEYVPQSVQPEQEKKVIKKRFFLPKLKSKMPKVNLRFNKIYIFAGVIVVLIISGAIGSAKLYTPSAHVRILVDQETNEQKLDFILDPDAEEVDIEGKIIPGEEVSVTLKGEAKKETTGTKLIGEAAEGTVTVYNKKTTEPKSFSAGTVLIAGNKIKFSLNEDIKVASASEEVGGLIYGKKDTGVKAQTIGPEGNIKKDSELVFEDYDKDNYSARAEDDFSGGTSREVSVVDEKDVSSLRKKIAKDLKGHAKQKLSEQKGGNLTLLDETLEEEFSKEVLSAEVGEQAKEVSLKGEVVFKALAYNRENISKLLRENAEDEIKKGYEIKEGVVIPKILDQKINDDGSVSFSAAFSTTLTPKINIQDLRGKLAGKPVEGLKETAGEVKAGEMEVIFVNKLPFFTPGKLPEDPEKIQITILPR